MVERISNIYIFFFSLRFSIEFSLSQPTTNLKRYLFFYAHTSYTSHTLIFVYKRYVIRFCIRIYIYKMKKKTES